MEPISRSGRVPNGYLHPSVPLSEFMDGAKVRRDRAGLVCCLMLAVGALLGNLLVRRAEGVTSISLAA